MQRGNRQGGMMLNSLKGLLSRKNDVPSPTVISLGQVWVDIMMDIDAIPQPGGFAVANHTLPSVGGRVPGRGR